MSAGVLSVRRLNVTRSSPASFSSAFAFATSRAGTAKFALKYGLVGSSAWLSGTKRPSMTTWLSALRSIAASSAAHARVLRQRIVGRRSVRKVDVDRLVAERGDTL